MPRTKVAKSSKRNREAAYIEEKMREYDTAVNEFANELELKVQVISEEIDSAIQNLIRRSNSSLLQMKMGDFFQLEVKNFNNTTLVSSDIGQCKSICSSTSISSKLLEASASKMSNPYDEGYLTEESNGGRSISIGPNNQHALLSKSQRPTRNRTPGPLSSAQSRRARRSRSACDHLGMHPLLSTKSFKKQQNATEHSSRSKLRTPNPPRQKAFSADRTNKAPNSPKSPPLPVFMRWPRAGEIVLSKCGSPVVTQTYDKQANVNIPTKNGVISMQPVKLDEVNPEIIKNLNTETLDQIKTLHANLNLIVNMVDRVGLNQ